MNVVYLINMLIVILVLSVVILGGIICIFRHIWTPKPETSGHLSSSSIKGHMIKLVA